MARRLFYLIFLITLLVIGSTIYFLMDLNEVSNNLTQSSEIPQEISLENFTLTEPIHFVTAICTQDGENSTEYSEEKAVNLVKSVLISALAYGVKSKSLVFHLFADSREIEERLMSKIDIWRSPLRLYHGIYFRLEFHGKVILVPGSKWRNEFGTLTIRDYNKPMPCNFIQILIQQGIPKYLDKVIYLDADTLVTGNVGNIWNSISGECAMTLRKNSEHSFDTRVIMMNLTRMRDSNITSGLIGAYQTYKEKEIDVNDLQPIYDLLRKNMGLLELLPCHYNFQYTDCQNETICLEAGQNGIQIVQGSGKAEGVFNKLYHIYKNFDLMEMHDNILNELVEPLKQIGRQEVNSNGTCNGILGKLLFKNIAL